MPNGCIFQILEDLDLLEEQFCPWPPLDIYLVPNLMLSPLSLHSSCSQTGADLETNHGHNVTRARMIILGGGAM